MDRETHEQAKKQLAEITEILKDSTLTPEERSKLESLADQLAGCLMRPWLPFGWGRRLIMIGLFLIGLYGLTQGNNSLLFAWLLIPAFSPSFVAECLRFSS